MTFDELWFKTLGEMEIKIGRPAFLTWLKNSKLTENRNGDVTIALPNHFAKEWVETKYGKTILGILRSEDSSIVRVIYIVDASLSAPSAKKEISQKQPEMKQLIFNEFKSDPESGLNTKYSLNSFVVGGSNELAFAAATSIIDAVGKKYNPFFIYGGTGLGKTHLIQAMGNEIHKKYEKKHKVKYVTSEKFTNDVIWAIKNKRIDDIKNTYRNIDVLIIDDIQFIGGKEKTEEEFFHTFNALYDNNKQIIISSDRPPKAIPILEDRLRSRFEGGMIVDIGFPDYETRMAIIKTKLQEQNEVLDDEIVDIIARRVQRNIRELEGILTKIIFQRNHNPKFSVGYVEKIMEEVTAQAVNNLSPALVIKAVSEFYEIPADDLIGKGRKKEIVEPRQIVMYLMREVLNMSYPYIAEKLGKRDHTTAIYAYEKIVRELNENPALNQKILMIKDIMNK